jgi:hypothetical protein
MSAPKGIFPGESRWRPLNLVRLRSQTSLDSSAGIRESNVSLSIRQSESSERARHQRPDNPKPDLELSNWKNAASLTKPRMGAPPRQTRRCTVILRRCLDYSDTGILMSQTGG